MTNFEYHKDEILEATKNGSGFGIKQDSGRIVSCSNTQCSDCRFSGWQCTSERVRWGYEKHVEKPKLTKKERMFCELVGTGWIARDRDGSLFWYLYKPHKSDSIWKVDADNYNDIMRFKDVFMRRANCRFSFIIWIDKEPWSVEDLLKLEYERGEDSLGAGGEQ